MATATPTTMHQTEIPEEKHAAESPLPRRLLLICVGIMIATYILAWGLAFAPLSRCLLVTLPGSVLLPTVYFVLSCRQHLASHHKMAPLFSNILATTLAYLFILAQWAWLISVRIPLNRQTILLADRAALAGPMRLIDDAIGAYSRHHGGLLPPSLLALIRDGYLQPRSLSDNPVVQKQMKRLAFGTTPTPARLEQRLESLIHLSYVGSGLNMTNKAEAWLPILASNSAFFNYGTYLLLLNGRRYWLTTTTGSRLLVDGWNATRKAQGLFPISLPQIVSPHWNLLTFIRSY